MAVYFKAGAQFIVIKQGCEFVEVIPASYVPYHHAVLHSPGIVSVDEPHQTFSAVAGQQGMITVNGLAFDKEPILIAIDRAFVPLKIKEDIRFFVRMILVKICNFRPAKNLAETSVVESRNFSVFPQTVFNDFHQKLGNDVFIR